MIALALTLAEVRITRAEISFQWVTVGDPGNPNDPLSGIATGGETPPVRGAVPYVYSISKYETTIGQYTAFLNAVAKSDPGRAQSLYSSFLGSLNVTRGIARISMAGKDVYYVKNLSSSREGWVSSYLPITFIDYWDAVRFVNWLHNGQGSGSTETGAYTISQDGQITRSPGARFWIPTENEWYKAAYYDPSPQGPSDDYWLYPWRSDSADSGFGNYYVVRYYATSQIAFDPRYTYVVDVRSFSGVPSYYGTESQAGNVEEWTEGDSFSGGPHTRGGCWDRSYTETSFPQRHAFQRMASYFARQTAPEPTNSGIGFRVATGANPPGGGLKNGDFIRFHPRTGHNARMVGGVFEASTFGTSYEVLHTISQPPPNGWTEVPVEFGTSRFFRYRAPDGGHGNVAEIEFYRSGAKLIAAASGTPGSWNNLGSTFDKALDGNVDTFFDTQEPNGAYLELDSGRGTFNDTPPDHDRLTVTNATGTGTYPPGQRVGIRAINTPPGQYFAGWEGFTSILDDLTTRDTVATIPGVGLNLWLTASFKDRPPGHSYLFVENGSGDGLYPIGTTVNVSANRDPEGREFAGWTADIAILSNPFLATTTAIVPSIDAFIIATYSAPRPPDTIRFYPRLFHTARMVGGVFEGTNGDAITGPYSTIYTISSEPPLAWNEVNVDFRDYRYLRYRGPTNSFGNVAEIEFYRDGTKLPGQPFGTPGSWSNLGNTFDQALDGNLDTFFDAPLPTGAYVGIDTAGGAAPNDKIRFYPRLFHTARMVGGVFEGTNADPINGPYTTIYTISSEPPLAWNEISVDLKDYRYLRYRGATESFGNVAEIEFYRHGAKLSGQSFGTPGSWSNLGNTFDKALDGNLETFFDAPIPTGAYVGIDSP